MLVGVSAGLAMTLLYPALHTAAAARRLSRADAGRLERRALTGFALSSRQRLPPDCQRDVLGHARRGRHRRVRDAASKRRWLAIVVAIICLHAGGHQRHVPRRHAAPRLSHRRRHHHDLHSVVVRRACWPHRRARRRTSSCCARRSRSDLSSWHAGQPVVSGTRRASAGVCRSRVAHSLRNASTYDGARARRRSHYRFLHLDADRRADQPERLAQLVRQKPLVREVELVATLVKKTNVGGATPVCAA